MLSSLHGDMFDVAVIGAGPAGSAAAITAHAADASVVLLERSRRDAAASEEPEESFHPGCAGLLERLGLGSALTEMASGRFPGIVTRAGLQIFGQDASGPWLGYHVTRARLDLCLRQRARALGVILHEGAGVRRLQHSENGSFVLETNAKPVAARVVIDASGARQWLGDALGTEKRWLSQPFYAWRGAVCTPEPQPESAPARFSFTGDGWLWWAPMAPDRIVWTQLSTSPRAPGVLPSGLPRGRPTAPAWRRGAAVTWCLRRPSAGTGYLLAGEAAAILDPAGGQGVLFALASGIMAGRTAAAALGNREKASLLFALYDDWLVQTIEAKAAGLAEIYAGQRWYRLLATPCLRHCI